MFTFQYDDCFAPVLDSNPRFLSLTVACLTCDSPACSLSAISRILRVDSLCSKERIFFSKSDNGREIGSSEGTCEESFLNMVTRIASSIS